MLEWKIDQIVKPLLRCMASQHFGGTEPRLVRAFGIPNKGQNSLKCWRSMGYHSYPVGAYAKETRYVIPRHMA